MTRPVLLLFVVAACAGTRREPYVPGGAGLPGSARERYRKAVDLENRGKPEQALAIYDELSRRYPTRLAFHLPRIRLTRRLEGPRAAANLYDPPPMGVGADRAAIFTGLALIDVGDTGALRNLLEFATSKEPAEAYWRLAVAELELEAGDRVIERAERARALGEVGTVEEARREAKGFLDRAETVAEEALRLDPGLAAAQNALGYIATRQADLAAGDYEVQREWRKKAGAHYERALRIDRDFVEARINLAENHLYSSDADKAIRELRLSAEAAPALPVVWKNLGVAYFRDGKVEQAAEAYRRVLQLEPKSARTRVALSDCLYELDETTEAIAELEKAERDGGEDRALRAVIAFKLGAIYEYERRYAEAVKQYERHVELGGRESGKAKYRIRRIYDGAFE